MALTHWRSRVAAYDATPTSKETLPPIRPSAAIQALYQKRLDALIDEMHRSILWWVQAAYRAAEPEDLLAEDAAPVDNKMKTISQQLRKSIEKEGGPAKVLLGVMRQLGRHWQRKFDEGSQELADYFATAASKRVDATLTAILRKAGISVRLKLTAAERTVMQAATAENAKLITNIASEHLAAVQGAVMRSVAAGRDIGTLRKELIHRHGITKKRAAFIARQENNKATAMLTRVRQDELGIHEAKWVHSRAGKEPRQSHVSFANGKDGGPYYDIRTGALIDGENIFPGELFNCRCVSRSVLPALGRR